MGNEAGKIAERIPGVNLVVAQVQVIQKGLTIMTIDVDDVSKKSANEALIQLRQIPSHHPRAHIISSYEITP